MKRQMTRENEKVLGTRLVQEMVLEYNSNLSNLLSCLFYVYVASLHKMYIKGFALYASIAKYFNLYFS